MAFLEIDGLQEALRRVSRSSRASISSSRRAASWCWSARPAAASPRCSTPSPAWRRSPSGEIRVDGRADQRSASLQARHRHGVPELCALSEHDGGREHRLRHGDARRAEGRARQGDRRGRQDAADRPPARPQAEPAVRRPAPARRHGPGAGARPAACSCSTSRCPTSTPSCASTCAPRSSACMPPTGTTIVYVTHDQIEAMTLATKIAVHEGRRGAAVRHAGRDLQPSRQPVRRRLHGLAGDEPDPGDASPRSGNALSVVLQREAREPITLPMADAPAGLSAFQGKPSSSASGRKR